jgi:methionyl aminopeptidase
MQSDQSQITAMRAGGHKLAQVRDQLVAFTQVGTSFEAIEAEAQRLIAQAGAKPNFSLVPGYHWATCVMKNDEVCHGIPQGKQVDDGDVITIDVGLLYQDYHVDTSITFAVGQVSSQVMAFLATGRKSLAKAIEKVKPGATVYDISRAMQKVVERQGYGAVYQLTGHGIGRELHQDPSIPCVAQKADKKQVLKSGQTIAIEIMYTQGDPELVLDEDGWTYRTADGSLTGMFEETVLVTDQGYEILTQVR